MRRGGTHTSEGFAGEEKAFRELARRLGSSVRTEENAF
jgi:hypothetical protein